MGNTCCGKKKKLSKIVLLLVGLDNAGKTVAARNLSGDSVDEAIAPTVGFSLIKLKHSKYVVHIFDLGGGSNIRSIWDKYFVDAHGIIFVIDSTDLDRLSEVQSILTDMLAHEKVRSKPLLVLANKQDDDNALDEIDLVERIQLEALVNAAETPTLVETCCAREVIGHGQVDRGIWSGYNWLVGYIIKNFEVLNERVEKDIRQQLEIEHKERIAKVERIYANRTKLETTDDVIELYSDYETKQVNGLINSLSPKKIPIAALTAESNSNSTATSAVLSSRPDHNSEPQTSRVLQPPTTKPRPKSATVLIRQQLQLGNLHLKKHHRNILSRNKTTPASFYGTAAVTSSQSARERSTSSTLHNDIIPVTVNRSLKSAGDSVLNRPDTSPEQIHCPDGRVNLGGGDHMARLFHTNVFLRPHSASASFFIDVPVKGTTHNDAHRSNNGSLNIPGELNVLEVE